MRYTYTEAVLWELAIYRCVMRSRSDNSFDFFRFWHDGVAKKAFPCRKSYDRILARHGASHLHPKRR